MIASRNRHTRTVDAFVAASIVACCGSVAASDSDFVPNQTIVRPRDGVSIDVINARYGSAVLRSLPAQRWYLLEPPVGLSEDGFRQILITDPDIEIAELNVTAIDTDTNGGSQSIFLPQPQAAYEADQTDAIIGAGLAQTVALGAGIIVAVIDSGVDAGHPLLVSRIAPGGFNFIEQNTDTRDLADGIDTNGDGRLDEMAGHGTFVAGIIARIAPASSILPIRVLDSDGGSNAFFISQAVYHALAQGATVANISIGAAADSEILRRTMLDADAAGLLIVASAGNEGSTSPARLPASLRTLGVLGVAATDPADVRAEFSNFGEWVSLSAPGVSIVSLLPDGGYGSASGTSFAAPVVAGVAALLRSTCPAAPVGYIRGHLSATSTPIDAVNPSYAGQLGAGRVHAASALASPACWADANGTGSIDFSDITHVITNFNASYAPAPTGPGDVNRDASVDFSDVTLVLTAFGTF